MTQPIVVFGSGDSSIVFENSLKSQAAVDVNNALPMPFAAGIFPTFNASLGMLAETAAIRFNGEVEGQETAGVEGPLDTEGQMSITVTTTGIAVRDDGAAVNGSLGVARPSLGTIVALGSTTGGITRSIFSHSTSELLNITSIGNTAEVSSQGVLSQTKPTTVVFTISWTSTTQRWFVNGTLLKTEGRITPFTDNGFFSVGVGASLITGTNNFFSDSETLYLSNIVFSNAPVVLNTSQWSTYSINGDSFALQAMNLVGQNYDGALEVAMTKPFIDAGFEPPAYVEAATPAESGGTICDTNAGGVGDLSRFFTAWGTAAGELSIFLWSNNDAIILDEADALGPTGTDANGKTSIDLMVAATDIVMINAGSYENDATRDTAPHVAFRDGTINPIVNAWESYDSRVKVIDALSNFGDATVNPNYRGWWDNEGNDPPGSVAPDQGQDNFHPHGQFGVLAATLIYNAISPVVSPTLTTAYTDQSNLIGSTANIDLTTNYENATTFTVTGLPTGLSSANGVVTGTVTAPAGPFTVTVVASNGSFSDTPQTFIWNALTAGSGSTTINSSINSTIN